MAEFFELLGAIREGDREAFDILVRTQSRRLYSLAFRVTRDAALAEDVVQETFLRLVKGALPPREAGTGQAWLKRVVTHLSIDALRRVESLRRREGKYAKMREMASHPSGDPGISSEEAELLAEGLGRLTPETRAALWLHVVEGDPIREVAACLRTSRSAVFRRVQSGLRELRQFLGTRGLQPPLLLLPMEDLIRKLPEPAVPPSLAEALQEIQGMIGAPAAGAHPPPPRGAAAHGQAAPGGPAGATGRRTGAAVWLGAAIVLVTAGAFVAVRDPFGWRRGEGKALPEVARAPPAAPMAPAAGPREAGGEAVARKPEPANDPAAGGFQIRGVVLDQARAPVPRAAVRAYPDPAASDVHTLLDRWGFVELVEAAFHATGPLAETRGLEDGSFSLAVTEPGAVLVLATAVGVREGEEASGMSRAAVTPRDPIVERLEIAAAPGRGVTGVVTDREGAPIAGARLLLIPDPVMPLDRDFTSYDFRSLLESWAPLGVESDHDGRFAFPALPLETAEGWQLLARGEGFASGRLVVRPPPASALRLTLERTVSLPGQVKLSSSQLPAPGARILALSSLRDDRGWWSTALSGDDGRFVLDVAEGASFELFTKLPGFVRPWRRSWKKDEDRPPLVIEIPDASTVTGNVYFAATGLPAAGVRLLCRDLDGALLSAEATTGKAGEYVLQGLPDEVRYDVLVALPGYLPREPFAGRGPGEDRAIRYDIALVETAAVRGRVLDPRGDGVAGAVVEVVAAADSDREGVNLRWRKEVLGHSALRSDESGAFVAADVVARGKVFVWAYHPEAGEAFAGPVSFSAGGSAMSPIDVVLGGGGLEVRLTDAAGQPLAGAMVELLSETVWDWIPDGMNLGQWYAQRTSMDISRYFRELDLIPGSRRSTLQADGSCRWTDLGATRYQVSVHHGPKRGRQSNWEQEYWLYMGTTAAPLKPMSVLPIRIVLDLDRKIGGRVTAPPGKKLPPLRVQVWYDAEIPGLEKAYGYSVTHVREDETFEATGIGPGPYRVTVQDVKDRIVEVKGVPEGAPELKIVYTPAADE